MPRTSRKSGLTRRAATYVRAARGKRAAYVSNRRGMDTFTLNNAVRKYIMKKYETKIYLLHDINQQLYHRTDGSTNYVPLISNLLQTSQGTTQYTRVGDKIRSMDVDVKLWLSNKLDRPNVMYRIICVSAESADLPAATSIVDLFYPTGAGTPPFTVAKINVDKYRVHHDHTIQPFGGDYSIEASSAQKEHSRLYNFRVVTNKDIVYKADNGTVPSGNNFYSVFVLVYDAYGSLATDNIASCAYCFAHRFKDM